MKSPGHAVSPNQSKLRVAPPPGVPISVFHATRAGIQCKGSPGFSLPNVGFDTSRHYGKTELASTATISLAKTLIPLASITVTDNASLCCKRKYGFVRKGCAVRTCGV